MSNPNIGVIVERPENESVPVLGADFSKIGIVTTAADASNSVLPLGVAKRFGSRDPVLLAGCGVGNYLADAIRGINDQLPEFQSSADLIIVRVAVGGSLNATLQNVVDGLEVLRQAPHEINATPRIIICPGYTNQNDSVGGTIEVERTADGGNTGAGALTLAGTPYLTGVKAGIYEVEIIGGAKAAAAAVAGGGNSGNGTVGSLTADTGAAIGTWTLRCVEAGATGKFLVLKPDGTPDAPGLATVGSAYNGTAGLNLTLADGSNDFAVNDTFTIVVSHSVPSGGGTFKVTDPDGIRLADGTVGNAYTTQIAFTLADGTPDFVVGDKWEVEVTITAAQLTANPVVAALPSVLAGLLATAYVDTPDSSLNAAENWRETIQSDRIMAIGLSALVLEGGEIVSRPMASRVAGLVARIDNTHGGKPFNPFANRPIYGIVGTNRYVPFSLTDGATEGQLMLAADIAVVVRGELGVDGAAAEGGFAFFGTDSMANGELWAQIHQVRGADYIAVECIQIARSFLGRAVTADLAEAWLNSIKFMLRDHAADNDILKDFEVRFLKDENSPEQIRLGHLTVTPKIEPCPAFKVAHHKILRHRPAVDGLVDEIISRLGAAV